MGRKRKIDAEGASKSSLPPCRVCGAAGAGFHYGANTCEACKGFFHRSLKMKTPYKCESGEMCVIEHGGNKLCQHCRYLKCLSVGMAKEAIKTGRYTTVKRTNDILEIKRLQQKQKAVTSVESVINDVQPGTACGRKNTNFDSKIQCNKHSSDYENITDHLPTESAIQLTSEEPNSVISGKNSDAAVSTSLVPKDGSQNTFTEQESESQSSQACVRTAKVSNTHRSDHSSSVKEIETLFSESHQDDCQQLQVVPLTSSESSLKSSFCLPSESRETEQLNTLLGDVALSPTSSLISTCLPTSPSSLSSTPGSYMMSPSLHSPLSVASVSSSTVLAPSPVDTPTSPVYVRTAQLSPQSPLDVKVYTSPSPACSTSHSCLGAQSTSEWYSDKDLIVQKLLEADENFLVPLYGRMTEAEMKRQHQEHFETCRLQKEMFGELPRLPDHEYDYIFVTTGLDTDDRQKRLHMLGVYLEKMIRAMVNFCKAIPGFCNLSISDKVKLIKYSRQEFYLFIIYKFIDSEKRILRGLDNQWKCENELSRMSTDSEFDVLNKTLDLHFKFCTSLQNLKLSDRELVVIRALIVMAPDRDEPVGSPVVREIYWQLSECLVHVLSQRYPNPLPVYAKIVDRMTEARSQTEGLISHFRKLKMDKYSDLMRNPLLREMCAGVFFDYEDDDILLHG